MSITSLTEDEATLFSASSFLSLYLPLNSWWNSKGLSLQAFPKWASSKLPFVEQSRSQYSQEKEILLKKKLQNGTWEWPLLDGRGGLTTPLYMTASIQNFSKSLLPSCSQKHHAGNCCCSVVRPEQADVRRQAAPSSGWFKWADSSQAKACCHQQQKWQQQYARVSASLLIEGTLLSNIVLQNSVWHFTLFICDDSLSSGIGSLFHPLWLFHEILKKLKQPSQFG